MSGDGRAQPVIQSVSRAIAILRCFDGDAYLSLSEVSRLVGLHKSTAAGIINTLKAEGFLDQDTITGKLRLGLDLFSLAIQARRGISEICEPYLNSLLDLTGETVNLAVFDKNELVYIAKKESRHSVRISTNVGARVPLHCTAIGKAILAFMNKSEARNIIDKMSFKPLTKNTITKKDEFLDVLDTVLHNGVAYDFEEFQLGLTCVASPLFYKGNNPIAAISVSGPTLRLDEATRENIANIVKENAEKICGELARLA